MKLKASDKYLSVSKIYRPFKKVHILERESILLSKISRPFKKVHTPTVFLAFIFNHNW